MKRLLFPALLAAIAVFIWMFISWALLPWHGTSMKTLPENEALIEQLKSSITEPGLYYYPGMPQEDGETAMQAWVDKYRGGPVIPLMIFIPDGAEPWNPNQFIFSFIINFLTAFVAAFLLKKAVNNTAGYFDRVLFVTMIGLFTAFAGPIMDMNWWKYPSGYSSVAAIDMIVTWFIAGLILAWRIKSENP